ncbi:enoyl-CoA hydratase [Agrococcus baldri]|uniref:Enoyl-CoA hydratase n=2 Tax=Agrococcus baldri TaxID=153730 RepID=A0AA87RFA2_9MICO|nr:enoyl-CoA hydratase [Agrococcus baldri]
MTAFDLGDITVEISGGVATLTLDREPANALDVRTAEELTEFLRKVVDRKGVRAILLTGSGRRFCTGADIAGNAGIAQRSTIDYRFGHDSYTRLFQALWEVEVPVVSAVNGTVAGVGWMLALLADLVVADEAARWTHVFTRRGMVPHAGDPYFLARIIPFHRLNEIALLSDPLTSATLAEWGLVNRAVAAEEVLPTARALADRLAAGPTRSLGVTKQLYRRSLDSSITQAFSDERAAVALISTTHDRREGLLSFKEGRDAQFVGD